MLIESQTILREALANVLASVPGFSVTESWSDAETALEHSSADSADIVLVGLGLPDIDGIEFIRRARGRYSHLKAIVLTAHKSEKMIYSAFDAGAKGYISKDASFEEISFAIKAVCRGEIFLSPSLMKSYICWNRAQLNSSDRTQKALDDEYITMLKMAREGKSNKEIAESMGVPITTVKSKFSTLMKKLDANDRTHCVTKAIRTGILTVE